MDFSWTTEQNALWDDIVSFAKDEIQYCDDEHEQLAQLDQNWDICARKGLFGLHIPEALGGCGYDTLTTIRALEAFGYGCPDNGLAVAVNANIWSVQGTIYRSGTDAQKDKYLRAMVTGQMKGAFAITEEESGSDAFNLQTTATKTDGGYILNGEKVYITMSPVADVIITFAVTNADAGKWGITAFLVDTDLEGVVLTDANEKMGLRTIPTGDVTFHDVFIPDNSVLGRVGAGANIFSTAIRDERGFLLSSQVGAMARQLDESVEYARTHMRGGQAIGKHQAVSHRIVDMQLRLETARMFLYRAAWSADHKQDVNKASSMAKLIISETFIENSLSAVRINGAKGYMSEFGIERDLRDAVVGVIYAGTSDIQRNLLAELLGL